MGARTSDGTSDGAVLSIIDQMERWIEDPTWVPDSEVLAQWNVAFQGAMGQADRGSGWEALVQRAHAVGARLEARMVPFIQLRDDLKAELDAQERGNRALKGYGAGLRPGP